MASKDSQPKTRTQNTGAEAAKGEIRIVLIGKMGVGKSELGNCLLGRKVYKAAFSMKAVTSSCTCEQSNIMSTLKIIDTPGLFDNTKSNVDQTKVITDCIKLSKPGPHVFIVVVSLASRFTPEDQETVDYIETIFSDKCREFMIVVFTNKQHSDVPIDDTWVRHANQEPLKSLLEKCNYRFSSIDNKGEKQQEDVKSILDLITKTVKGNNNLFYSGEMYGEAAVLYMKYMAEKKEKEEKMERLEKEKEEIRERLEKEKKEKEELKIQNAKLERENKERVERLEKEMAENLETADKEKEDMAKQLERADKERVDMKKEMAEKLETADKENQQLKKDITGRRERVRGPMKEPDRTTLQTNIPQLSEIIAEPDRILESLCAKRVFDRTDREVVEKEKEKNNKAGVLKLLNLLLDCGSDAFQLFEDCLRDNNYIEALEILGLTFVRTAKSETKKEEKSSSIWQKFRFNKNKKTEEKKKKEEEEKDNGVKSDVGYDRQLISKYVHPLHEESFNCEDMEKYKIVVAKYIQNINTTDVLGSTPLLKACISKYHPIEKLILLQQSDGDINKTNNNNNNALHLACRFGSLNTVKYLIEELQFNIKTPGFTGQTPLLQSSKSEESPVEKINYLISKGVNVKTVDNNNDNVLHLACSLGSLNTVKYLIEELQFNIETPGYYDRTSLHQSSYSKISPVEKINVSIHVT